VSVPGSVTRSLVRLATWPAYHRFIEATLDPQRAQRRAWEETALLLQRSSGREAWRPRLQDHPITSLDDYRPAIERSLRTGVSALNGEPVMFWSQSAGTTGNRKLFPMTRSFRRQFQRTVPPMVHALLRRYPQFLRRPALYFAATDPRERTGTGVEIGFISNYNYRTVPALIRRQYAFPREVFKDAATFDRYAAVYALGSDLSAMFAVTPMSLQRLLANIREHGEFILRSLRGEGQWDHALPRPSVSPDRLRTVTRLLESGDLGFKKLWPSLDFVCTWKTAICAAHLRQIADCLEGVDVIDAIYSATEGWITVPIPQAGGSVVHPGAHVFEFIEAGKPIEVSQLTPPWELKPGRLYEVFLTTAMGLVRYRLNDVVSCTGFFNRAPVIEFAHKSGGIISLGLVSVSESELVEALLAAGVDLEPHWRVGPTPEGNGLALYADAADPEREARLEAADAHLRSININYRIYTGNGTLKPLSGRVLRLTHSLWARDAPHAQTKPVLLIQSAPE
jgi:hypothetical protein